METEVLRFKIGLSTNSTGKEPAFKIVVNDSVMVVDSLKPGSQSTYFEFEMEVAEGPCSLIVEFTNKSIADTVLDDGGNILRDILLNIDSVEVDDIDLGQLLWTASQYYPDYPESYRRQQQAAGQELPESVTNCVNLGWNGTWKLPFTSPFYIWLLENI